MATPPTKAGFLKPIEESLLSLEGIEQAHVRLSDDGPAGVRVVLAADADKSMVANAIRELFTSRGLTVALDEGSVGSVTQVSPPEAEQSSEPSGGSPGTNATVHTDPPSEMQQPAGPTAPPVPSSPVVSPVALAVAVSEGPTYCDVAVRIVDRRSVRRSNPDPASIREAILDGLNEASGRSGIRPTIVSVDERIVAKKTMITVVLESSGQIGVGSALVRGTGFHAFGQAALAALGYLPNY